MSAIPPCRPQYIHVHTHVHVCVCVNKSVTPSPPTIIRYSNEVSHCVYLTSHSPPPPPPLLASRRSVLSVNQAQSLPIIPEIIVF